MKQHGWQPVNICVHKHWKFYLNHGKMYICREEILFFMGKKQLLFYRHAAHFFNIYFHCEVTASSVVWNPDWLSQTFLTSDSFRFTFCWGEIKLAGWTHNLLHKPGQRCIGGKGWVFIRRTQQCKKSLLDHANGSSSPASFSHSGQPSRIQAQVLFIYFNFIKILHHLLLLLLLFFKKLISVSDYRDRA